MWFCWYFVKLKAHICTYSYSLPYKLKHTHMYGWICFCCAETTFTDRTNEYHNNSWNNRTTDGLKVFPLIVVKMNIFYLNLLSQATHFAAAAAPPTTEWCACKCDHSGWVCAICSRNMIVYSETMENNKLKSTNTKTYIYIPHNRVQNDLKY